MWVFGTWPSLLSVCSPGLRYKLRCNWFSVFYTCYVSFDEKQIFGVWLKPARSTWTAAQLWPGNPWIFVCFWCVSKKSWDVDPSYRCTYLSQGMFSDSALLQCKPKRSSWIIPGIQLLPQSVSLGRDRLCFACTLAWETLCGILWG